MIRKIVTIMCMSALLLTMAPALAVDNGPDPLNWAELTAWASSLEALAAGEELLNDPAEPEFLTEDGYLYSYDFGNLYFSEPAPSETRVLKGAVIYDEDITGPRETHTDQPARELLAAYYTENEDLEGTREEALIYLADGMPEGFWWGRVQRDGQRLTAVQYTVHERCGDGTYTDAGVVYTLQENTVVAVRVFGLDERVETEELEVERALLAPLLMQSSYRQVPASPVGAENTPFDEDDLTVLDLDFLSCTPEIACAVLGMPEADEEMPGEEGQTLRVLSFTGCTLVFARKTDGQWQLTLLTLEDEDLEGPRAIRVGDSVTMVLQRFRFGEGELQESGTEVLYGTPGEGQWGEAEYGEDASVTLRYGLTLSDGRTVVLRADFETLLLREINLYLNP